MENSFFGQVKDELTEYGQSLGEIGQLRLAGIISRTLGLFLLILTVVLCALALFTFGAVAVIDILANYMEVWEAALIIGSTYIILIVIAFACRRKLFINPFIKLLTKQIKTEQELELHIMDAEHRADMQRVRMECQVENATREFDFYVNLISRMWDVVKRWLRK